MSLVGSPGVVVVVVAWREIVLVCVEIVCGDYVGVTKVWLHSFGRR